MLTIEFIYREFALEISFVKTGINQTTWKIY